MIIRFDKGLSKLEVYAQGIELAQIMGQDRDEKGRKALSWPEDRKTLVHTFDNPVLVTDTYRIGQLDPVTRDTLSELSRRSKYTTEYDGTVLEFNQQKYPKLWGPNIDTLLFCRALSGYDIGKRKEVVEIGAGSGFISKYLLEKSPDIREISLVDINPNALNCWKDNIQDGRAVFHIGDGIEYMKGKKFDVILCNPPYIPRPSSIDDNAYEGIGLLTYLLEQGKEHLNPGGVLITNISTLCQEQVDPLLPKESRIMDSLTVPLKVGNVRNNKEWREYLEKRGLKNRVINGYEYWHTIKIYEIKKD
jgi:release factor glutamine methyltransferase